jgi:hypothetical protein
VALQQADPPSKESYKKKKRIHKFQKSISESEQARIYFTLFVIRFVPSNVSTVDREVH